MITMKLNTYWKPNKQLLLMETGSWYAAMITEWDGEQSRVLAMDNGNGTISLCYPQPNRIEEVVSAAGDLGTLTENRYMQHHVPVAYFVTKLDPVLYYHEAPRRNQQIQFSCS
jgi:hypothetical protein